jgi:hypothetical protein
MLEELLLQDKIAAAEEVVGDIVQDTVFRFMEKVAADYGFDLEDVYEADPELFDLMYKMASEDVADYYAEEVDDGYGYDDIDDPELLALAEEIDALPLEDQIEVLSELGL